MSTRSIIGAAAERPRNIGFQHAFDVGVACRDSIESGMPFCVEDGLGQRDQSLAADQANSLELFFGRGDGESLPRFVKAAIHFGPTGGFDVARCASTRLFCTNLTL